MTIAQPTKLDHRSALASGPAAPSPMLDYAFSAHVELAGAVELGTIGTARRRCIPITGGRLSGPRLSGIVLPGGGDWQDIFPDGLTRLEAHYLLQLSGGTLVEVTNPGIRTASPEVSERLANGGEVGPLEYYFRTTPRFEVAGDDYSWLRRSVFIACGVRRPDHVIIDFYIVL